MVTSSTGVVSVSMEIFNYGCLVTAASSQTRHSISLLSGEFPSMRNNENLLRRTETFMGIMGESVTEEVGILSWISRNHFPITHSTSPCILSLWL
jgi:hypothetical protein